MYFIYFIVFMYFMIIWLKADCVAVNSVHSYVQIKKGSLYLVLP